MDNVTKNNESVSELSQQPVTVPPSPTNKDGPQLLSELDEKDIQLAQPIYNITDDEEEENK